MTKTKEKTQIEKFREKARELETDESEASFERIVRKLAKTPPQKAVKAKKKKARAPKKKAAK